MDNRSFSRNLKDQLITVARRMGAEPTLAEKRLWHHLRELQLSGFKFRRQQIINRFIVDFYCPEARFVIEVDGGIHKKHYRLDAERDAFLRDFGYRIVRFTNQEIFIRLPKVLNRIQSLCAEARPVDDQQSPFPFQGEG